MLTIGRTNLSHFCATPQTDDRNWISRTSAEAALGNQFKHDERTFSAGGKEDVVSFQSTSPRNPVLLDYNMHAFCVESNNVQRSCRFRQLLGLDLEMMYIHISEFGQVRCLVRIPKHHRGHWARSPRTRPQRGLRIANGPV